MAGRQNAVAGAPRSDRRTKIGEKAIPMAPAIRAVKAKRRTVLCRNVSVLFIAAL